jgi:hypothetical protein
MPARIMGRVITSGLTIPLAIVAATSRETNAPRKLRMAAPKTAKRGDIALVEILVAIALAVSWKPFVKSKNKARITTVIKRKSIVTLRSLHLPYQT